MTIDPRDVSLWVVTGCGTAVLIVFTVYFVITVLRLIRQLLAKTDGPVTPVRLCPCGKKPFGSTILRVDAADDGPAKTILNCTHCGREHSE